jgi:hypothetical protein
MLLSGQKHCYITEEKVPPSPYLLLRSPLPSIKSCAFSSETDPYRSSRGPSPASASSHTLIFTLQAHRCPIRSETACWTRGPRCKNTPSSPDPTLRSLRLKSLGLIFLTSPWGTLTDSTKSSVKVAIRRTASRSSPPPFGRPHRVPLASSLQQECAQGFGSCAIV